MIRNGPKMALKPNQKPKPVWFMFKAWANGVNQPSRQAYYRTPELKASAMDLQRLSNAIQMRDQWDNDERIEKQRIKLVKGEKEAKGKKDEFEAVRKKV